MSEVMLSGKAAIARYLLGESRVHLADCNALTLKV